jgi:hypothetical protein
MSTPSVLLIPDLLKAGKLYSQIPNSGAVDFDVTRATTAYRTNASGILESVASGVPRLDYPIGGGCPSLLIEPAATNLVLRSEEFNTTWTAVAASVTANAATAPNGTLSADKLIDNATLTNHRVQQTTTSAAGSNTFSVFAKKSEVEFVALRIGSDIGYFNLNNGTFGGLSAGITARTIDAGNGWYRCIITKAAAIANENVLINTADAIGSIFYAGTSGGIFLWGAQYEVGSVATSYIPTVAATATRNADVISKTGVSGFIGQSQGTLYAEVDFQNLSLTNRRVITIRESANSNNFFQIERQSSTQLRITARLNSGTTINFLTHPNAPISGVNKIAFAYQDGNYALALNGIVSSSAQAGITASLDSILLGQDGFASAGTFLNDRIRTAAIYPTRLTNSQLASLTTL